MKRLKKTNLIKIVLMVVIICSFAICAHAYEELIEFENFSSYSGKIGGNWKAQGLDSTASVVETDRGTAVKLISESTKMLEVFQDFTPTEFDQTSFMFAFSAKYGGAECSRGLYTRTSVREYPLMYVDVDQDRIRLGNTHHSFNLENDVWYDFQLEYNTQTGYTRCTVSTGNEEYVLEGTQSFAGISGLWRVNFPAFTTLEGQSETYITNVGVYSLDYEVKEFAEPVEKAETFETFNHSANRLTAPDGWKLQNTAEGSTKLSCEQIDGSPYGKSLVMYWDGKVEKVYELIRQNLDLSDNATISLDLRRNAGSQTNIAVRGVTETGSAISYASVAYIDVDGNVKVNNKAFCVMEPDKWYNFRFSFNLTDGTYTLAVSDGSDVSESEQTKVPRNVVGINAFELRFASDSMTETCFYIDNCVYEDADTVTDIDVMGFATALRGINPMMNSVEFAMNSSFNDSSLEAQNISAVINGTPAQLTINGNNLVVNSDFAFEPGKVYMVEVTGDNGLGISRMFVCRNLVELLSFEYSKESVQPGALECDVQIASYTPDVDSCIVVSVLKNKSNNNIVQTEYTLLSLSDEASQALNVLTVPENGEYYAETFIWKDVFDMKSMFAAKTLE